jgi:hypothetical protein
MSMRRLVLAAVLIVVGVMVTNTIREQRAVRAFDKGYTQLVQELRSESSGSTKTHDQVKAFYDKVPERLKRLEALPRPHREYCLILGARLHGLLTNLQEAYKVNPLEAGDPRMFAYGFQLTEDLYLCVREGVGEQEANPSGSLPFAVEPPPPGPEPQR